MMMLNRVRSVIAVAALASVGTIVRADVAPDMQVKSTTEEVLAAIAKTPDRNALRQLAEAKVAPHFNFRRMTQLAVGRAWSQASPQQQSALEQEFRSLLVRTYTTALATAKQREARVEVQPARPLTGGGEVVVKTRIVESGGKAIAIDYQMEKTATGWKVYDLAVENISLVVNYRQSFDAEVQRGGIDGLIHTLAAKNRASGEPERLGLAR